MEDVIAFVLKQIPLIVFMSIVIWQQQKEKNGFKDDLKVSNDTHTQTTERLNADILQALIDNTAAIVSINTDLKELRTDFKDSRND